LHKYIFVYSWGETRIWSFGADLRDWLVVQHGTGITNQRVEPKYSERYPRQRHFVHCTSHTTCPGIEADENGLASTDRWDAVREQVLVMALLLEVNCHRLNWDSSPGCHTTWHQLSTGAVKRPFIVRCMPLLFCWSFHSV